MGVCVSKNNELPINIFKVRNIDESGNQVGTGYLEVTDSDIVFRSQAKDKVMQHEWPLKYLRKYGCDGDIFSFEAGHRCQGGEGIYAFATRYASRVFDLVQASLNSQSRGPASGEEMEGSGKAQSVTTTGTRPSRSPTKERSPPKQANGHAARNEGLSSTSDSKGSLRSSTSEVSTHPVNHSMSSLRPDPPSTIKEEEEKDVSPTAADKSKPQYPYAQVVLPAPSSDKPLPKVQKTSYTKIIVDSNGPIPAHVPNGAVGGEYVNYAPKQGMASEQSPTATTPSSPSNPSHPPVNYSNLNFANGEVTLVEQPKLNYVSLDFQKDNVDEAGSEPNGKKLEPKKPVILGSTIKETNYTQLDYNAMDTALRLAHDRERIKRT